MAHVASQHFFHENYMCVCFFFDNIMIFQHFSNQKKRALKFCEDRFNFQPVNPDLTPFRAFLDDVRTKITHA